MASSFGSALDSHFGIHAPALQFHSARSRVLASNLTNADTPNFKARDIEFSEVLKRYGTGGPSAVTLATTNRQHIAGAGSGDHTGPLKYRNPFQPSLDGNTVETDVEQANFARNAIEYQTSLMFLGGKIRGLRDAIRGGQ